MKKAIEIGLNVVFWIVISYIIFNISVAKSIEIEVINEEEFTKISYDQISIWSNLVGLCIKIAFYYSILYYLQTNILKQIAFRSISWVLLTMSFSILLDYIRIYLFGSSDQLSDFNIFVFVPQYIFFTITAFAHHIILNKQKEEDLKQKYKEEKLDAELKLLKSQISPHFLFNALNNLLSLAEKYGQNEVSDGISQLSEMLRFLLHDTPNEKIFLSKEIEFITNYLELNKLRFSEKDPIRIEMNQNIALANLKMAPAILIPFVENAVKHGISIDQESFINISLTSSDYELLFTCSNSIIAQNDSKIDNEKNSGVGLENIKRRLSILYANKHELSIRKMSNIFQVSLKIQLDD